MLRRIIKLIMNEYLRNQHARTGQGPRRLPPLSASEARNRMIRSGIRKLMKQFGRR